MSKIVKVDTNRYTQLISDSTSLKLERDLWAGKELRMLDRIAEQESRIASLVAGPAKDKSKRLKQCYNLAIKMNDPIAAANIATLL